MSIQIYFHSVGRDKKSWTSTVDRVSGMVLYGEVRRNCNLASREIDFMLNDDGTGGTILVGGCRPVGRFVIEGGVSLGRIEL